MVGAGGCGRHRSAPNPKRLYGSHPPAWCMVADMPQGKSKPPKNLGANRAAASRAVTRSQAYASNEFMGRNPDYVKPETTGDKVRGVAIGIGSLAAGPIARAVTRSVGVAASRAAGVVAGNAAFDAATKGLEKASAGGRVFRTVTPFGPTLGSTRIMTPSQRSASIGGLVKRGENIGNQTERVVASTLGSAANTASKVVGAATTGAAVGVVRKRSRGGGAKKK